MSTTAAEVKAFRKMAKQAGIVLNDPIEPEDKDVEIRRDGVRIVVPEGMSLSDARIHLERQERAEETVDPLYATIDCYPIDGLVALNAVMTEVFGHVDVAHGTSLKIPNARGELVSANTGQLMPPAWEGGFLTSSPDNLRFRITGQLKRKFHAQANEIIDKVKRRLATQSMYRGHAIRVNFDWAEEGAGFFSSSKANPIDDAPKFMDLFGSKGLILNRKTETQLATSVYMLLEHTEACRANDIPLKHGVLLQGTFGTGKTLTAKVIADKAVANGWTFIYLDKAEQLVYGLQVAKMYAPAVVFAEDIDTAVSDRDADMNEILNTLDGIDTKNTPILTVLTTNKIDKIEPVFLRAGRIDTMVTFTPPDAETAARFVRVIGNGLLAPDVDVDAVGVALAGLVPAFITEAISKAKRHAIYRTGLTNIEGQINTDDLLRAAEVVREHAEIVNSGKKATGHEKMLKAFGLLHQLNQCGQNVNSIAAEFENL